MNVLICVSISEEGVKRRALRKKEGEVVLVADMCEVVEATQMRVMQVCMSIYIHIFMCTYRSLCSI
jgi:hypothetical protein